MGSHFVVARDALMDKYKNAGHRAKKTPIPCPFDVRITTRTDDVELHFNSNPRLYTYSQVIERIKKVQKKIPGATAQEMVDALREYVERTGKRYRSSAAGVEIIFDTPAKALAKLEDSVDSLQPHEVEQVKEKLVELLNKLLNKRRKLSRNSSEVSSDGQADHASSVSSGREGPASDNEYQADESQAEEE